MWSGISLFYCVMTVVFHLDSDYEKTYDSLPVMRREGDSTSPEEMIIYSIMEFIGNVSGMTYTVKDVSCSRVDDSEIDSFIEKSLEKWVRHLDNNKIPE
mgnify:CR=1 FL=1